MTGTWTGVTAGSGTGAGMAQPGGPEPVRRRRLGRRSRLVVLAAGGWLAATVAVGAGLAEPPAGALLVAAPVIASAVVSVSVTALFAVLAVGAAIGLGWVHHWSSALANGLVVGGVAAGSVAAVGVAAVRTRAEQARAHAEQGRDRERRRRRAVEASDQLHRLAASLASCGTVSDVAETTFAWLRSEAKADAALLCVVTGVPGSAPEASFVRAVGYRTDVDLRWQRDPVAPDMPGRSVVMTGTPVFAGSADALGRKWPATAADVLDERLHAVCVLPLVVSGAPVGFLSVAWASRRRFTDEVRAFLQAVADQCAQAIERARLAEADRTARRRLAFLGDVSRLVASSLEPGAAMARLVDLVTGQMADACAVLVPDGPGLRCEALTGRTPVSAALLGELLSSGADIGAGGLVARALAEGRRATAAVAPGSAADLADGSQPDRGARRDPVDVAALPLIAGGERIGVMVFMCGIETPPLQGDDVPLASEVAARASTALYNAARFQHERGLSALLQRAVLPEKLPAVPGVSLDAVYQAGTAGTVVGGDWFDVVELDDGRVFVSVGDVVGEGPAAAALMGQVRSAARAYGVADPRPGRVLWHLDRLLATYGDTRLVTATVAVVEPGSGRVRLASAGHPPALVVGPWRLQVVDGGRRRMLGVTVPDARVGSGDDQRLPDGCGPDLGDGDARLFTEVPGPSHGAETPDEVTVVLGREDVLVLYSDGLVERRGEPITDGIDRLLTVAGACRSLPAWSSGAATCLADALAAQDAADDVVVLTVGTPGAVLAFDLPTAQHPPGSPGRSAAVGIELPAEPASGPAARKWLTGVLAQHQTVPVDVRDAAEILVGELVANAVIHAGTAIAVGARVDGGAVHVEVADGSPLLPVEQDIEPDAGTGRGLLLVSRMADAWGVVPAGGGKVVWFDVGGVPDGRPDLRVPLLSPLGVSAPRRRSTPASATATVALLQADPAIAGRSSSHFATVWRELHVLVGAADAATHRAPDGGQAGMLDGPRRIAGRLTELAPSVVAALAPVIDRWRRARLAGSQTVDTTVTVDAAVGPVALELAGLLDEVDRRSGHGQLLVVPASPDVVAFRRWVLGEVAAQCAGGRPTPWSGTAAHPLDP